MTCFDLKNGIQPCPCPKSAAVVALGIFDGVHLGHKALLDAAVKKRDELISAGIPAVALVWSFFEQPKNLIKTGGNAPALTDTDEKLGLFAALGIDYCLLSHFDDVRDLSPEDFVREILISRLRCRAAVSGFNFRFGRGGSGDTDTLRWLCSEAGVETVILPPVMYKSRPISSSTIRLLIESGETEEAAQLLGRPFFINFPVVHGKALGRTIGIPTINQNFPEGHIIPAHGIYACRVEVGDDRFIGVTNIGVRPTVEGDGKVNSETHIINYSGLLYGKRIKVLFYKKLRDEMKFASVEALKKQIELDISAAKEYFSK